MHGPLSQPSQKPKKVTGPCLLVDPQPPPHNDLIPIARLPPEILNTIFTILCSIDRPKRRKTSQYHPGWLSITYVCQRWRHIALHQPTLWASSIVIPFAFGSRWADAFLSRSQGTPLAIHRPQVVQRLSLTPAELMVINENLARIRILCLTTTDAVLPTLCAPAPLLHTLDLSFIRQYMAPPVQPPLPDGLLGGRTGAPELRHLRVTSYGTLPWTSPLLAQLVSLEVVLQGNVPAHNGECAAVLDALRGMHVLERLVLLGFELGIATERPVVTLAALRYLELSANTESACYLLTHIALPGARVQCNMLSPADPVELVNFFSAVAPCVDTRGHPMRRILIAPPVEDDLRPIQVTAWRIGDGHGEPAFGLRLGGPNHTDLIRSVIKAFASEHLEELHVRTEERFVWPDGLGPASRLRCITVEGTAARALCISRVTPADFLPGLPTLVMRGVNFNESVTSGTIKLADALAQRLEKRARAGHVLKVLDVVGCGGVTSAFVRRVRDEVPELVVRWGQEEGVSENANR